MSSHFYSQNNWQIPFFHWLPTLCSTTHCIFFWVFFKAFEGSLDICLYFRVLANEYYLEITQKDRTLIEFGCCHILDIEVMAVGDNKIYKSKWSRFGCWAMLICPHRDDKKNRKLGFCIILRISPR